MPWIFFRCCHATHKEQHIYNCHSAAKSIISINHNIIGLIQCCFVLQPQGIACWMSQRAPCRYQESCQAQSTAWTSSASRSLERSLSTAPTPQTVIFAASCGVGRTGRRSAPPRTAACPGLTAPPVASTGPASTECACQRRRWCGRW